MKQINGPCPSCLREETGKWGSMWYSPCPADDCPSHWEEKGIEHPDYPADTPEAETEEL